MREPMTLREIARIEGISHQAVIEIIERALKKVFKALKADIHFNVTLEKQYIKLA